MIGSCDNLKVIVEIIKKYKLLAILDPVLYSSSGYPLSEPGLNTLIIEMLLPHLYLITPNLLELAALTDNIVAKNSYNAIYQADILVEKGTQNILIKGGHNQTNEAIDILYTKNKQQENFNSIMLPYSRRGTGCALSTAITALLAKNIKLIKAIPKAKEYMNYYISQNK